LYRCCDVINHDGGVHAANLFRQPSGSLYAPPPRACVSICSPICGLSPILAAFCEQRSSQQAVSPDSLLVLCHLPLAFWVMTLPLLATELGQDQTKKRR
jgi:hypothetical protein